MKRRDFLFRSAGLAGVLSPVFVRAQSLPCMEPTLSIDNGTSATTTCKPVYGTLAPACAALSSGQSAAFAAGQQSAFTQGDLEWQSNFYHDATRGLVHLMGKTANLDTQWKHQIYNVATGKWAVESNSIVVSGSSLNNKGHIYGNMTMDFASGDVYLSKGGMNGSGGDAHSKRLARWDVANGNWIYAPASQDIYSGALESHMNGVGWHPNLYGSGDGGLIVDDTERTMFWRKSSDAVDQIAHTSAGYGNLYGEGVYWDAHDVVIIGCGQPSGVSPQLAMVAANSSAGGQPVITVLGGPPLSEVGGDTRVGGSSLGSLHVHPDNPSKLILIGTTNSSYYTATLSGSTLTWSSNLGTHPFTADTSSTGYARVTCSLRGNLGCLWGIATDANGGQYSELWKPPV